MGTHMKAVLCLLLLVGTSCSREGENPVAPDATPVPASPPRIRSVVVVPSAIARGGTAQVRVDAFDPGGATVVCSFSAEAGQISIPDPAGGPCVGAYTNDGKARASDTITIVATGAAKLSATATDSGSVSDAHATRGHDTTRDEYHRDRRDAQRDRGRTRSSSDLPLRLRPHT